MTVTEQATEPRFATVVRGYDRPQVDDYVARLQAWLDEAEERTAQAEAQASTLRGELEQARRSARRDEAFATTPAALASLGEQVEAVLHSSFATAEELRARAEAAVRASTAEAEQQVATVLSHAAARAEELCRAAEEVLVEADEQAAERVAAAEAEAARLRAEAQRQHDEIVQQAHQARRQILERAADEERTVRQQVAALAGSRQDALAEIARLQQHLSHVSGALQAGPAPASEDGDSAPDLEPGPDPGPPPTLAMLPAVPPGAEAADGQPA